MQIVGYDTDPDDPALLVATAGEVCRESIAPGVELDYGLRERHCAGVIVEGEDGSTNGTKHRACDTSVAPYCETHAWPWSPTITDEDHAIYLTGFAPDAFKVGVTRSWRLDRRLREQGADRAAHVATVVDGQVAREREAEIADRIDGSDRVRVPTKIAGLHRAVDPAAWDALLADSEPIETFEFEYGLDLDVRPVAETLAAGRVQGVQGRVLVLDAGGTSYAVDLRDLVGHEVEPGASGPDRQSSLAGFE